MIKPKLFILAGISYSGKSTLSKHLINHYSAETVSYDEVYPSVEATLPAGTGKTEEWKEVQRVTRSRVRDLLLSGFNVIYDDLSIEDIDRKQLLSLAAECGAVGIILYMDTPIEIIRERQRANDITKGRAEMDEENLQFTLSKLEKPSPEESIWVSPDENPQNIFNRIDSSSKSDVLT